MFEKRTNSGTRDVKVCLDNAIRIFKCQNLVHNVVLSFQREVIGHRTCEGRRVEVAGVRSCSECSPR